MPYMYKYIYKQPSLHFWCYMTIVVENYTYTGILHMSHDTCIGTRYMTLLINMIHDTCTGTWYMIQDTCTKYDTWHLYRNMIHDTFKGIWYMTFVLAYESWQLFWNMIVMIHDTSHLFWNMIHDTCSGILYMTLVLEYDISRFILPQLSVCQSIFLENQGTYLLYAILWLVRPPIKNILDSCPQYLSNFTFGTSLACQRKEKYMFKKKTNRTSLEQNCFENRVSYLWKNG